jgi:hypothetical protein
MKLPDAPSPVGVCRNPQKHTVVILSEAVHRMVQGEAKNLIITMSYKIEILPPPEAGSE